MSDFGKFVRTTREYRDVSQEELSKGICTGSEISKIEKGQRDAGLVLQCVLMGRLNVTSASYSNYVFKDEYDKYICRENIVSAICREEYDRATSMIDEYEKNYLGGTDAENDLSSKVEIQFCEAMKIQIMRGTEADDIDIFPHCIKAAGISMSHIYEGFSLVPANLLTFQEFDILLEYVHSKALLSLGSDMTKCYEKLYDWVIGSDNREAGRALLIPKLVVYYAKYLRASALIERNKSTLINYQCKAIECLRKSKKGFYLYEIVHDINEIEEEYPDSYMDKLDIVFLNEVVSCLNRIYEQYKCEIRMKSSAFIYREKSVFFIGDVISRRQKMFGLTNEEMCHAICDDRVLRGLKTGRKKTQSSIAKALLKRVNLIPDFVHSELVTDNKKAISIYKDAGERLNGRKQNECTELLDKLEMLVSTKNIQNIQVIEQLRIELLLLSKSINIDEAIERMKHGLEYTCKIRYLNAKELFITETEMQYISCLLDCDTENRNLYFDVLKKLCNYIENSSSPLSLLPLHAYLRDQLNVYYNSKKRYTENKNGILYVLPGCMQEHIIYQLYRFDYTLHQIDYRMETISKECFKASCLSCVKICEFCFDNYDADFYKSVYSSL